VIGFLTEHPFCVGFIVCPAEWQGLCGVGEDREKISTACGTFRR
jgi:hypothetical protein